MHHTSVWCVLCVTRCVALLTCVLRWGSVYAWAGVWACVSAWQGEQDAAPHAQPLATLPHTQRTHILYHGCWRWRWGAAGGGGVGGSKIKLKIKACPESPSAPCQPARRGGGCRGSHSTATRAGVVCLSIQSSYRAPAHPAGPAPSMGRSAIDGARRAPGAG